MSNNDQITSITRHSQLSGCEAWHYRGHECAAFALTWWCANVPVCGCFGNTGLCADVSWCITCPCRIPCGVCAFVTGCWVDGCDYVFYCGYRSDCEACRQRWFGCDPFVPVSPNDGLLRAGFLWKSEGGRYVPANSPITVDTCHKLAYYLMCTYVWTDVWNVGVYYGERCKCCKPDLLIPYPTAGRGSIAPAPIQMVDPRHHELECRRTETFIPGSPSAQRS